MCSSIYPITSIWPSCLVELLHFSLWQTLCCGYKKCFCCSMGLCVYPCSPFPCWAWPLEDHTGCVAFQFLQADCHCSIINIVQLLPLRRKDTWNALGNWTPIIKCWLLSYLYQYVFIYNGIRVLGICSTDVSFFQYFKVTPKKLYLFYRLVVCSRSRTSSVWWHGQVLFHTFEVLTWRTDARILCKGLVMPASNISTCVLPSHYHSSTIHAAVSFTLPSLWRKITLNTFITGYHTNEVSCQYGFLLLIL